MSDHTATPTGISLSNKSYDYIKALAQYVLPALGALYFALASIWGFQYAEQVIGTITAVDIFLGVVLGFSSKSYNSGPKVDGGTPNEVGSFVINTTEIDRAPYRLELDADLADLENKDVISFRVKTSD